MREMTVNITKINKKCRNEIQTFFFPNNSNECEKLQKNFFLKSLSSCKYKQLKAGSKHCDPSRLLMVNVLVSGKNLVCCGWLKWNLKITENTSAKYKEVTFFLLFLPHYFKCSLFSLHILKQIPFKTCLHSPKQWYKKRQTTKYLTCLLCV